MNGAVIFALWLTCLGPILASFVTAMADRFCAGAPMLAPRSRCMSCHRVLGPFDLVPILSYLALRGRCRNCAAPIPRHVWRAEVAGLVAALLVLWSGANPLEQGLALIFFILLIGLFETDRQCFRLPDALTLPLLAVGLAMGSLTAPLWLSALAAAIGAGGLWGLAILYRQVRGRDGLGFGDVKMMAGLSAAVGPLLVPWITLIAAGAALITAAFLRKDIADETPIPFGCYLAVAGAIVWLWS